jgi:hypothetical protein
MATTKRPTKSKPAPAAAAAKKKKAPAARPAPAAKAAAAAPKQQTPKPAGQKWSTRGGEPAKVVISPLTGLPVREKIHLPIKGYGRLNAFQVVENLYGKSVAQLKQILEYEEKHQGRRMVIDRINDMIRRAGGK